MKYQPGQSLAHSLHPVVKSAWLLWVTVAVFVFDSVSLPLFVVGCAAGILWLSGVAPWRVPGIRVWLVLGGAILVTHALSTSGGESLVGPVTTAGLITGTRAMGRLLAVILMSALFVMTTEPVSLACALMRIGLPYRWGFALVTALRLAPIFRLDAHHIYRAQLMRGVAYFVFLCWCRPCVRRIHYRCRWKVGRSVCIASAPTCARLLPAAATLWRVCCWLRRSWWQ